jgi:hypothetical protein
MSYYVFFEPSDEIFQIFQRFDNYERWPCVLLDPTDPTGFDRCDADDPNIAFWSVYGHFQTGGLECISDHEIYEEAKEFMETLPPMPRTPITPF